MNQPRRQARNVDGIVLLDKPAGLSSNQALQRVKRLYRAAKAGHTGSLDPLATGLLPVCLGEATKIAGHLLGARKAYRTIAVLGATTDTDDADGQVLLERPVPALADAAIEAALAPLRGRIAQRAPVYSALKRGGEPLYALARRGEVIEAPVREVEVHRLELAGRDGARLELEVECGSGTYVRSLVRDLGETLGCGAHVAGLRRLWVEPFSRPRMFTLEELERTAGAGEPALDALVLPLEAGLVGFPEVRIDAAQAGRLLQGQRLRLHGGVEDGPAGEVAVFGPDGRALGLAEVDAGLLRPRRLFSRAAMA
ncbi:tRNA pseudouridine(55) synthase TruB [Lysobacter sp. GX 14042]|uniref:tRNA pseudouridine(55) synthase TruB n=1 Tax=Lysobacter sp. GX 14042 TaxID=2907155 RepID=UPI001F33920D|nr:tRNA pseudouridine(55) synthase TruB [Lysobacter sp. GX 14042]MCE7031583.1 tRNA pseudouridine(55) synthase TruB [Lysobacter sp. GX 14042]